MQALKHFLALAAVYLALLAPVTVAVDLALVGPAEATISRVGTTLGTNTCTPTTHAIGDIIVIAAFRNTTGTPSLGAGYTSVLTKTGTTSSMRVGFKIATATNDASGTWTNATSTVCHVYSSSLYSTGGSLFIGASASASSTNNTVNYPALTLLHADATSWVLGFGGVGNLTETIATAPSGMTNESLETAAATQTAGHDTNGTVSSWSSTNATTTGTAGNSVSATVELIENQPGTAINNFVQRLSYAYALSIGEPGENHLYNFDPTLAGNGLVVAVCYPSGATPVITDSSGDTFPVSGAAGTVTADAGAGNTALQVFVLPTVATGTSSVTVAFGGSPQVPVKTWITQLYNITGTVNGTAHAAAVNSGGIVSPGSFTPTNNNVNGGNLILSYACDSALASTTNPALFVPETGYKLLHGDISWLNGAGANGLPNAVQFQLQATSAPTTPRLYVNAGGADTYNVAAIALSVGAQGTPKPSGPGVAPWIDGIDYFGTSNGTLSWLLQFPQTGTTGVCTTFMASSGTPHITSFVDSDGTTWALQDPTGTPIGYASVNQTPNSARTLALGISPTGQNLQLICYDISNTATSPIVGIAGVGSTTANNLSTLSGQPSITPSAANQLTIAYQQQGIGPASSSASPSGAVFDLPTRVTWKGTGSITGTAFTLATTTWGTFLSGAQAGNASILSGPGVSAGTTPQTGTTSPYVVQPSQSATGIVTMLLSGTDGDTSNWGNAASHRYNGSDLTAQSFGYNFANQPGNSVSSFAITLKGPAAAPGGATPFRMLMGVGQHHLDPSDAAANDNNELFLQKAM